MPTCVKLPPLLNDTPYALKFEAFNIPNLYFRGSTSRKGHNFPLTVMVSPIKNEGADGIGFVTGGVAFSG